MYWVVPRSLDNYALAPLLTQQSISTKEKSILSYLLIWLAANISCNLKHVLCTYKTVRFVWIIFYCHSRTKFTLLSIFKPMHIKFLLPPPFHHDSSPYFKWHNICFNEIIFREIISNYKNVLPTILDHINESQKM